MQFSKLLRLVNQFVLLRRRRQNHVEYENLIVSFVRKLLLRRTFITTTKKKERKLEKQTFNTKERKLVTFLLHYIAHWQGPCQKLSKNVSENKDQ